MSKIIQVGATVLVLMSGIAEAGMIQVGGTAAGSNGRMSSRAGVCTVSFDAGNAANECLATYSRDAAGSIALEADNLATETTVVHAAPVDDTSTYLAVGMNDGRPIYVNLSVASNYFGFYAGSLDSFNLVQFFMNGVLIDSFDGAQINAVAFPGQRTRGDLTQAQYIDYFPGVLVNGVFVPARFDRIQISSSGNSFETDNHAFGIAALAIPEPDWLSLFGVGSLLMFVFMRRRDSGFL